MKEVTTYLDCYDRPTKLTKAQLDWFHSVVDHCKAATGCTVDIIAYDHDLYGDKSVDALGCCVVYDMKHRAKDARSCITIDCYFINEQYDWVFNNGFNISGDTLEHVIAHEIAHLFVWRHGAKHSAMTEELYRKIQEYGQAAA